MQFSFVSMTQYMRAYFLVTRIPKHKCPDHAQGKFVRNTRFIDLYTEVVTD